MCKNDNKLHPWSTCTQQLQYLIFFKKFSCTRNPHILRVFVTYLQWIIRIRVITDLTPAHFKRDRWMVCYRKIWHTYYWCIYTWHILRWRAVCLTKHKWFCNETKEIAPIISIKRQTNTVNNRYIKMFVFSHILIASFSLRESGWIQKFGIFYIQIFYIYVGKC